MYLAERLYIIRADSRVVCFGCNIAESVIQLIPFHFSWAGLSANPSSSSQKHELMYDVGDSLIIPNSAFPVLRF